MASIKIVSVFIQSKINIKLCYSQIDKWVRNNLKEPNYKILEGTNKSQSL